jgi:transcription initiation factor IIE alpha subunit
VVSNRFPRTRWAHHDDLTPMDVVATILKEGACYTEELAYMVGATDAEIAEILAILERDGTISKEVRDYGGGLVADWWHLAHAAK